MTDIVKRIRDYVLDDHERGCQGRYYDCSCKYDDNRDLLMGEAVAEIERLRAVLELYRDAVRIDVTMEGPKLMGANSSALKRAWDADLATLGDHSEKGN